MRHLRCKGNITLKNPGKEEVAHNDGDGASEDKGMGRVVALMDDLFFQMKLAETAKQLGVEVKVATNGEALMELMATEPKLVIVDLNARSQPLQAIEKLRREAKGDCVGGLLLQPPRGGPAQTPDG